jgi:WD40 repeat protein
MAVAEDHPSVEELAAFTLGTLGDQTQTSIEAHVAACTSCQERAAVAPGDTLVELLRSVHARTGRGADTLAEAAAQVQTPVPLAAVALTDAFAPAVDPSAPVESDCPEVPEAMPAELARHERYRVVRLLGAGGMGAVYEAEHRVMQRLVALKVIKRACTADAAALGRFRREVRAAARLSHPNIVTTYDAEDAGETHFLVMEYVEGTDLGRLVRERGPLPVDRSCDYVRQAALGLQHAFEQGMVHRDLKPHNLMLTPDGRVKILDFGLACFASETASAAGVTGTGLVLGTVDYIAPEQADNAHEADIRADLYSLGCTLYHLLAGQPPFPTGTPLQKVMAHVEKNPQPLTELRPDVPEELMLVLDRMMAKKPRDRYQTPAEVALALEPIIRATAVGRAPRPRARVRATDPGLTAAVETTAIRDRRRPRFAIATAILAFLVTGLLGVAVYRIATDKGELVIETDNDDVEVVISSGGKVVKIIDTKSGKHVTLRSGDYELELKDGQKGLRISPVKMTIKRGETVLATIERVTKQVPEKVGEVRSFVGHTDRVWGVALSPTGRYALSTSGDRSLRLWDLQTGNVIRSYPGHPNSTHAVAFLPDGREFLSCSKNGTMRHWQTETGKQLHSVDVHDQIFDVAVSPDGLLALSTHGGKTLRLWDLKNWREIRRFEGHTGPPQRVVFSADGRRALSGGWDKTIRLWDVETGKQLRCFEGHQAPWGGVAISPDGRLALSGGDDALVRLWDLETGKELRRFQGHKDVVNGLAFSPDGRLALSGSSDRSIRLWEVATGKELHRFDGHEGVVYSVVFSRDGLYALSGSHDRTVRLWRLPDPLPAKKKP